PPPPAPAAAAPAPAPAGARHKRVLQVPVTRGQVPDVPVQPGLVYADQPGDSVRAGVVGDPLVALRAVTAGAVGGNLLRGGQERDDLLPDGGLDHIGDPPGGGRVQQVGVDLRPAGQPGESVDVGDGERDHGPSLWFLAPAFLWLHYITHHRAVQPLPITSPSGRQLDRSVTSSSVNAGLAAPGALVGGAAPAADTPVAAPAVGVALANDAATKAALRVSPVDVGLAEHAVHVASSISAPLFLVLPLYHIITRPVNYRGVRWSPGERPPRRLALWRRTAPAPPTPTVARLGA